MLLKIYFYFTDKNRGYIIYYKVVNYFMGGYAHRFFPYDFQTEHVNSAGPEHKAFAGIK